MCFTGFQQNIAFGCRLANLGPSSPGKMYKIEGFSDSQTGRTSSSDDEAFKQKAPITYTLIWLLMWKSLVVNQALCYQGAFIDPVS